MALKITRSTDIIKVKQIIACIYAVPGIGKTTFGFSAHEPLLLDFDHAVHRAKNRKASSPVETWDDVTKITPDDLAGYKTLVIDTAGRALDILSLTLIKENPKNSRGGGALSLQGFGELKGRFTTWLKWVKSFGLDIVLICHMDEQKKGEESIERLDVQGSSKNEIYKVSDVMGRLYWVNGKRTLSFNATDTSYAKNPTGLPAMEVPHYATHPDFLGEVLAGIKAELNKQTAEQIACQAMLADWRAKFGEAATAGHFTELVAKTQEADARIREDVKRSLVTAAREKGFRFDPQTKAFTEIRGQVAA